MGVYPQAGDLLQFMGNREVITEVPPGQYGEKIHLYCMAAGWHGYVPWDQLTFSDEEGKRIWTWTRPTM